MSGSRAGRGRAAAVVLLAAVVTALVAVPTWLTAYGSSALELDVPVEIAGTRAAPGLVAAALVLAAAGAALALVGRAGRWVVAVVVAGAGVLVVASSVGVLLDPSAAAVAAVAEATGVGRVSGEVEVGPWPWFAVVVGAASVALAPWLLRVSRTWSGSRRHEVAQATTAPDDERAAWDALSRGDDPT